MGLPSTGELSFLAIRTELGISGSIDLNNSSVRGLAGKASGTISFSDLRGKSNVVGGSNSITISASTNGSYYSLYNGTYSSPSLGKLVAISGTLSSVYAAAAYGPISKLTTAPTIKASVIADSDGSVLATQTFTVPSLAAIANFSFNFVNLPARSAKLSITVNCGLYTSAQTHIQDTFIIFATQKILNSAYSYQP